VSRILLLLIFLLWMAGAEAAPKPVPRPGDLWAGATAFLSCYALLVLAMRAWSGLLARRVSESTFDRKLRRYQKVMLAARFAVPAWMGIGIFMLHWSELVQFLVPLPTGPGPLAYLQLPGVLLGTLPAFAAWVGLWWSQYPADHALREQNILFQVEAGLPVYTPPGVRSYIVSNLRLQVLFTIVPILLIISVRDAATASYVAVTGHAPSATADWLIPVASAALVFLVAPEVLRRVLHTQPLPESPLRRRLEDLCRRTGMRYRDILLWRTQNNMGNAAVMGVVPQVRYILLSDLLLERMDDEQIEAVFAHEVGHVMHRHMAWFVVFFIVFFAGMAAIESVFGSVADHVIEQFKLSPEVLGPVTVFGLAGAFLLLFGFLSRRFERQADVYAARTIEAARGPADGLAAASGPVGVVMNAEGGVVAPPPPVIRLNPQYAHVGRYGATLFASALHRVAIINNMPVSSDRDRRRRLGLAGGGGGRRRTLRRRVGLLIDGAADAMQNWLHGSISGRMEYLRGLSADPSLTCRFDRFMLRLYCGLLFALFVSAAVCYATWHG
jgi:STE24 endopeptidase